jgi:hypothetical protein
MRSSRRGLDVLIEPACFKVSDACRPLRVIAFRTSPHLQLVRIWAKENLGKTSTISELKSIELRPAYGREAVGNIFRLGLPSYWLAVQVFNNAGLGWSRSALKEAARLEVPAIEIAFEDGHLVGTAQENSTGIVVSI